MLRDLLIMLLVSVLVASISYAGWSAYKSISPAAETESLDTPTRQSAPEQAKTVAPEPLPQDKAVQATPQVQPRIEMAEALDAQPAVEVDSGDTRLYTAVELFKQKDYNATIRTLEGYELQEAQILRGNSYFELGSFYLCTVELEKALASGISDPELRTEVEKRISLAYYKMDEIAKSYAHAQAAMSGNKDEGFAQFYRKLEREYGAAKDSHIQESSEHFKVVFDGYEHGTIDRTVLSMLEEAYSEVGRKLDYYPRQSVTVVLNTAEEFHDVTRAPSWAGGLYDGKIRIPVRNIENFDRAEIRRVLHHEYVHALVHTIVERAPHWVNEGLAEYLTQSQGPRPLGQLIPLNLLERGFPASPIQAVAVAYNESHEAVKYLVDRYGMYSFMNFLRELGKGSGIAEAFESAYLISYDEFLKTWGRKTG